MQLASETAPATPPFATPLRALLDGKMATGSIILLNGCLTAQGADNADIMNIARKCSLMFADAEIIGNRKTGIYNQIFNTWELGNPVRYRFGQIIERDGAALSGTHSLDYFE